MKKSIFIALFQRLAVFARMSKMDNRRGWRRGCICKFFHELEKIRELFAAKRKWVCNGIGENWDKW
jgi:Na+-transporting NADH:ubiquinone oxidoreductase subunit NqrF